MTKILPTLVYGEYLPGDWISRYCRFHVDLPAGNHRLTGRTYNPIGEDLIGNKLVVIVDGILLAEIPSLDPAGWRPFALDLPEVAAPARVNIALRTSRFRQPPPPDQRLLGLILHDLCVHLQNGSGQAATLGMIE